MPRKHDTSALWDEFCDADGTSVLQDVVAVDVRPDTILDRIVYIMFDLHTQTTMIVISASFTTLLSQTSRQGHSAHLSVGSLA